MYIELNFLAGLIGGIVIGMVIMILLVFVVCMTAIGYLKDDEQDGYPNNQPASPNMNQRPEVMEGPPISRDLCSDYPAEEGYPLGSQNMEPFISEKGYAPEDPAMHTETFSQILTEQQMEKDENVGVALEKSPVHHVVRETLVNEDDSEITIPNPEIIEE